MSATCSGTPVQKPVQSPLSATCSVTPVRNLFSHHCQQPQSRQPCPGNPYSHLCPATPVHYPVTSVHSVQQPLSIHPVHPPLSSIAATCALHTHSHPFHSPLSSHPYPTILVSTVLCPAISDQPPWCPLSRHLQSNHPCVQLPQTNHPSVHSHPPENHPIVSTVQSHPPVQPP